MNTLLIDVGNTRIKWRCVGTRAGERAAGLRFTRMRAMPLGRAPGRQFQRLLAAAGPIESVVVANVAGARVARALRVAARQAGQPAPGFVRTLACAHGVRIAYRDAWRLGVDRWLALIAARELFPNTAVCVAGAGTALTVDLLDRRGLHRGGAIIPGPMLMADTLLRRTSGIQRRAGGLTSGSRLRLWSGDTRGAVLGGAGHAAAALIERSVADARRLLGAAPRLLLTGGAAATIAPLLARGAIRQEDLVLRGLWLVAAARSR